MIEKNKRHMHFLWICKRVGQKPAQLANSVRKLKQNGSIEIGKHKVMLLLIKNTPDGRLYMLDLYEDGRLIRRSPCFLDQPRRGRNVRMVSEIFGVMLLVGLSITGVAVAYVFGSGLADSLMTQESCEILRFDVFGVGEKNAYYLVEAQNSGTIQKVLEMRLKADDQGWGNVSKSGLLGEFESHTWSATQSFTVDITDNSTFLVEVASPDGNTTLCTAQTRAK